MFWFLFPLILFGLAYDWLATLWLHRWLRTGAAIRQPANLHSVATTFFRPMKRGVPDLARHLTDFLHAVEARDQILFGVYADDLVSRAIIEKCLAAHPRLDSQIIDCQPDLARNPKINKLLQLAPFARHDHWIVMDSEIENATVFLPAFREEWAARDFPVFSAPYRFRALDLCTAPILHTLLPGLAVLRRFDKIDNTLGACIAVTRQHIEALGGWANLGAELAEDYHLGHRLAALGHPVAYAAAVVQLANDPSSSFRTLHRQTATYRHCQPWGFAGSLVSHVLFWTLLTAIVLPPHAFWPLFTSVCLSRLVVCHLRARFLGWSLPFWKSLWILLASSLLETAFWAIAWLPWPIHWAGRKWKI